MKPERGAYCTYHQWLLIYQEWFRQASNETKYGKDDDRETDYTVWDSGKARIFREIGLPPLHVGRPPLIAFFSAVKDQCCVASKILWRAQDKKAISAGIRDHDQLVKCDENHT